MLTTRSLLPLNALRAFEATARLVSFSKAAIELHVTPAAISHQVRALEDTLGHKLIVRRARSIELTAKGSELYPGLRDGFQSLLQAVERVSRDQDENVLVVSSTPGLTAKWLVPRLYRFIDANPNLEVRVAAALAYSNLTTDGVDVGIRLSTGIHPGLYVEKLMDETVLPLCSPALLAGPSRLSRPQDLARFNLIHIVLPLTGPSVVPNWQDWLRQARINGVNPARGLRFNMTEHALEAAAEGSGVVLAYKSMATEDIRSGRLVSPFGPELPIKDRAYYFACAIGREKLSKIARFRAWLFAEMKGEASRERSSRQVSKLRPRRTPRASTRRE